MSLKKDRLALKVLSIFLLLSAASACTQQTVSQDLSTVFKCVQQQENSWATFAQRGDTLYDVPILTWKTKEFGSEWTPEERCHHVSEKLTNTVEDNEGRLKGLLLTYGLVNNSTVICVVSKNPKKCDSQNLLFTLNQENAKNPSLILAKIDNYSRTKAAGSTISESGGAIQFISLEALVNRAEDLNGGL